MMAALLSLEAPNLDRNDRLGQEVMSEIYDRTSLMIFSWRYLSHATHDHKYVRSMYVLGEEAEDAYACCFVSYTDFS